MLLRDSHSPRCTSPATRNGGTGSVNLYWDPHSEILGSAGSGEVDVGGQRFT